MILAYDVPYTRKPTRETPISDSPITQQIHHIYDFTQNGGSTVSDHYTNQRIIFDPGNEPAWRIDGQEGIVITSTGTEGATFQFPVEHIAPYTLEFWCRPVPTDRNHGLIGESGSKAFFVSLFSGGRVFLEMFFVTNRLSNIPVSVGDWAHWVVSVSTDGVNDFADIYTNGVFDVRNTYPAGALEFQELFFLKASPTSLKYIGDFSYHRIWHRNLTGEEARSLYLDKWQIYEPQKIPYYVEEEIELPDDVLPEGKRIRPYKGFKRYNPATKVVY